MGGLFVGSWQTYDAEIILVGGWNSQSYIDNKQRIKIVLRAFISLWEFRIIIMIITIVIIIIVIMIIIAAVVDIIFIMNIKIIKCTYYLIN